MGFKNIKMFSAAAVISLAAGFSIATTAFAVAGKNESADEPVIEETVTEEASVNEVVMYDPVTNEPIPHISSDYYEVNENGQTYGVIADVVYKSDYPDLIGVIGDNGNVGYVYTSEFEGEAPSSPEEAIRMQKEREMAGNPPIVINVYESDGETVIDTFTME